MQYTLFSCQLLVVGTKYLPFGVVVNYILLVVNLNGVALMQLRLSYSTNRSN